MPCISERGTLAVQALSETDCRVEACEGRRNMVEMIHWLIQTLSRCVLVLWVREKKRKKKINKLAPVTVN